MAGLRAPVGVKTLPGSSFLHTCLSRSAPWLQAGFPEFTVCTHGRQAAASTGPRLARDSSSFPDLARWCCI